MVKVAGYTHIGKRTNNEDSFLIADNFAIVADGMGGHSKGEVASSMAVECICNKLKPLKQICAEDLLDAIQYANVSIFNKARENDLMQDMGTTVVMCAWTENNVIVANVGDSRCYLFSDNCVNQITVDHSYVQSLIDSGKITASEAESRMDKNIILRAAGCESNVETDIFNFTVKPGDTVVLCSDGLSGVLSMNEMQQIINSSGNIDEVAKQLVISACEKGGTDNITAVVIMFM